MVHCDTNLRDVTDWYYTSLDQIAAPDKALARWAADS